MIRVGVAPCDVESVYNYRALWPAQALAAQAQIEYIEIDQEEPLQTKLAGGRVVDIKNPPKVDVLVFTRLMAGRMVDTIPIFQSKGIAVVVDLDDAFRHLPALMRTRSKIEPKVNPDYNWRHLLRACSMADVFTCSTKFILEHYGEGSGIVIRNCVPERYLSIRPEADRDGLTVGWTGAVNAHPGDLEATRGGVAQAIREVGGDMLVVGPPEGVAKALDYRGYLYSTGMVRHERYPYQVAQFDVGIAPLALNPFTEAKSWLKPLQYMALGVPWVGARSYEYELLHQMCVQAGCEGLSAIVKPRSRDWRREVLRALRMAEDERQHLQQAGRDLVFERLTIEGQSQQWLQAWELAVERRKAT